MKSIKLAKKTEMEVAMGLAGHFAELCWHIDSANHVGKVTVESHGNMIEEMKRLVRDMELLTNRILEA